MSKLTLNIELSEAQVSALLANPSKLTNLLSYIKMLEAVETPTSLPEVKTDSNNILSTLAKIGDLLSNGQGSDVKNIFEVSKEIASKVASGLTSEKKEADTETVRQLLSTLFNKK